MKSGDVIVMTKESRLAYHAVPCIVKVGNEDEPPECLRWDDHANGGNMPLLRQTQKCSKPDECCTICNKYINPSTLADRLHSFATNAKEWKPFASYLATTRININVRQVHAPHEDVTLDLT